MWICSVNLQITDKNGKKLEIVYKYFQGTDAVRLTGVSEAISQQIAKYDSSEFDDDKVRGESTSTKG